MAREVIEQKLEALRRCLARIREKCPDTPEALTGDLDAQDIIALNLTRAVQLCVDIGAHQLTSGDIPPPQTMGQTFDRLAEIGIIDPALASRLKKVVGFRNIAVHNYEEIDWFIVHAIVQRHLSDFHDFARAVVEKIQA
ncbi:MAG: type VII toxin-antitoxin system HepT family RNase toxin [Methylohalobius sp. ZOD2]